MRGILRPLTKPISYRFTARQNFTLGGRDRRANETFDYTGDALRLKGLADPALEPSVVTEHTDSFNRTVDRLGALSWFSPLSQSDGYGSLAEEAILGLVARGVAVSVANIGWVDPYSLSPTVAELLAKPLQLHRLALMMTPPDDGMVIHRNIQQEPFLDRLYRQQFRILYTMFETDRLPRGWAERINIGADAVFVPSSFLVEAFKQSGVHVPVYHTPTGIDTMLYTPGARQLARAKGRPEDDEIRVLMCGTLTRRKNVAAGVKAFQEAAGSNPNWRLVVKTQPNHPEFEEFVKQPIEAAHDPRIHLVTERYTREQMISLYRISDIFLWPSFGEGIGLPPQEAMSCGLEVVAGRHSGALDFISDQTAYPVASDTVRALEFKSMHAGEDWGDVGNWWSPRVDELAHQLQQAAAATGKSARGPRARHYINRERHQTVTSDSILAAIEAHVLPRLT